MCAVKGEGLASAAQLLLGGAGSAVGTYLCFVVPVYMGLMKFAESVAKSCEGLLFLHNKP